MNSNWLLGLLAVAGAGGAYYLFTKNKRQSYGWEIAVSESQTKWFYEPISLQDAQEINSYCSQIGPILRTRNAQVLSNNGYPELAAACLAQSRTF